MLKFNSKRTQKFILFCLIITSCTFETPSKFSKKALNDIAFSINDTSSTIQTIFKQYEGKKILVDVWASWCGDCIKGLPKIKKLQKEFPKVIFLFLSVDEKKSSWKKGIQRFKIDGVHYNLPKGMSDGDFVDFLGLRWIPRYMVIDEKGDIQLFKATKASDERIIKALRKYHKNK